MEAAAISTEEAAPDARETVSASALALVGIVILAAALRFATLGTQGFSDDEQFTVWLIEKPFKGMLTTVPHSEATPHLYYVLAWLAARLFGTGEAAMRVLPALLGTATVAVAYRTAAIGVSRRVGLIAAGFAAVNPFLIWYSQEARAYALVIFLTALGLMFLVSYERSRSLRALAGWSVAMSLALASHYFALFVLIPEAAWLLRRRLSRGAPQLAAVALPVLAGLALLPLALHQRSTVHDPGGVGNSNFLERLIAIPKNFLVGFSIPLETGAVAITGALCLYALAAGLHARREPEARMPVRATGLALVAIALAGLLAAAGSDYVTSRNLVITLVPASFLVAFGFGQARFGLAAFALLAAVSVAIGLGVAANRRYQRRDWRGAAHALGPARAQRILVFSPEFSNPGPFGVYFGPSRIPFTDDVQAKEIALVGLADYGGFGPGSGQPPAGPEPPAPPGFSRAREVSTPTYRLVVYSARTTRTVNTLVLRRLAFPRTSYVLVSQTPR